MRKQVADGSMIWETPPCLRVPGALSTVRTVQAPVSPACAGGGGGVAPEQAHVCEYRKHTVPVLSFMNYSIIFHTNNCQLTFAPPCTTCLISLTRSFSDLLVTEPWFEGTFTRILARRHGVHWNRVWDMLM